MKNRLTKVCDGMKKMMPWIIASAVIMLVFPWLAVTFVKGDGGMAVCFILFFALNPIYAIFAGAQAVSYTHLDVYKRQAGGSVHHPADPEVAG